jgi:ERCC4-related helicase
MFAVLSPPLIHSEKKISQRDGRTDRQSKGKVIWYSLYINKPSQK